MFRTTLQVAHIEQKDWKLITPLVWEGKWEYLIIRSGFVTDFASIPRPLRWVLDSAGGNSEAAVLHDAAWRESKHRADARVDPWHADGMFRRALRETGSTALARALMWFAVRVVAMVHGRLGRLGPQLPVKILQLAAVLVLGAATALVPTVVAVVGLVVYWVASWVVAVIWRLAYERRHFPDQTNWPWPAERSGEAPSVGDQRDRLLVIVKDPGEEGDLPDGRIRAVHELEVLLAAGGDLTEEQIEPLARLLEA